MTTYRIKTTVSRRAPHGPRGGLPAIARAREEIVVPRADEARPAQLGARRSDHARVFAFDANEVDACAAFFDVCRRCQKETLDPHGIACMFDVDNGPLPAPLFRILKSVVEMILADIATGPKAKHCEAVVSVTLKHERGLWALAIAENLGGAGALPAANRRLAMVRALTHHFECVCRVVPQPKGSAVAVAFMSADRFSPVVLH